MSDVSLRLGGASGSERGQRSDEIDNRAIDRRENSAVSTFRWVGNRNSHRATRRNRADRAAAAELARGERTLGLLDLYLANDLAGESCFDLSAPRPIAALANNLRGCGAHFDYGQHFRFAPTPALSNYRLAVVSDYALTGNWIDPGRQPGARRSLQLPASDRALDRCDLGDCRSFSVISLASRSFQCRRA